MAEEKKVESKKDSQKMVPLSELLAIKISSKERIKKLEAQLKDAEDSITSLESDLEIAKSGADDEEVADVKRHLLEEKREIEKARKAHEKDVATLKEERRVVDAEKIVARYKAKGLDLDIEALQAEEDMTSYALDHYADFLERREKTPPASGEEELAAVHENETPTVVKKQPKDMTDAEFDKFVATEKQKSLSKR